MPKKGAGSRTRFNRLSPRTRTRNLWAHSPHSSAQASTVQLQLRWTRGGGPPGSVSLWVHERCAALDSCLRQWMTADPLWTESKSNLVWHLWRASDNLHDTATERSGDIDLKSGSSKIRFLCVRSGAKVQASVLIRAAQARWGPAGASLTTLGSSGLTSCSLQPSNLSAVITETFLSSLPALRPASPFIPAECVECWTTELSSQAATGRRRGNEEQRQTRAPGRSQQAPSHMDEHRLRRRIAVVPRAHLQKRCPCAACSWITKSSLGELIESVHVRELWINDRLEENINEREKQRCMLQNSVCWPLF